MTVSFSRQVNASPHEVLAAIEANGREWRESLVPPELRRAGVTQVEGRVRDSAFTLRFIRKWYGSEGGDPLELRGHVIARDGGGSVIEAEVTRSRVMFIGAAVLGALGLWVIASGGSGGAVMIGLAIVVMLLAAIRDRANTGDAEDRYLLERLEQAIAAAEASAGGRPRST